MPLSFLQVKYKNLALAAKLRDCQDTKSSMTTNNLNHKKTVVLCGPWCPLHKVYLNIGAVQLELVMQRPAWHS